MRGGGARWLREGPTPRRCHPRALPSGCLARYPGGGEPVPELPLGPSVPRLRSLCLIYRLLIAPNAPGSTELVARSALRAFACVHPGGGHPGGRRHTTARDNHERYPGPASFRRISSTRSEVAPARLRRWHASRSSGSVTFGIREMSSRSSFWVLTYRVGQATSVAGVEELSLSDRRAHPAPTSSWLRSRWPIR
ncbi:hypothetical protein BH20ACT21_BH20ACT21_17470 [soil metagenome]